MLSAKKLTTAEKHKLFKIKLDNQRGGGQTGIIVNEKGEGSKYIQKIKEKSEQFNRQRKQLKKLLQIERSIVEKAVISLIKHTENLLSKPENTLVEEEDFIHLSLTLTEGRENITPRPIQINLEDWIYGEEYKTKICLLVKDSVESKYKQSITNLGICGLGKVMEYSKALKYNQSKTKKNLAKEYDLFFCDIRIYKLLPKILGPDFYKKGRFPYPLEIEGIGETKVRERIEKAIHSAYFMLGSGPHYSIRIGRTSLSPQMTIKNILRGVYIMGTHILRSCKKYIKIKLITLKTTHSIELPIFHLEQGENNI